MAIRLNVPLVQQDKQSTCWYACACMLGYYRAPGPRLGLPDAWAHGDVRGLAPSRFAELATAEGLRPVPNANRNWTPADLESALRTHGPLWCAGQWQNVKHVIVVTGVDPALPKPILINDPAYPTPKSGTLDWFNHCLDKHLATPMLYAPPGWRAQPNAAPANSGVTIGANRARPAAARGPILGSHRSRA